MPNTHIQAIALFDALKIDAPTPPTNILSGAEFSFTKGDNEALYENITGVTLKELTECNLEGEGVFDKLMNSVDNHIQREFKNNRISGSQYAEVYTAVMTQVLSQSTSFLLQKDQARWSAITAQMQARVAEIQATAALVDPEKTKIEAQTALVVFQDGIAQYALTKLKLASEDANIHLTEAKTAIQDYNLATLLPSEVAMNAVQSTRILPAEATFKEFQNTAISPITRDTAAYNLATMLPAQKLLLDEQGEAQHAQTNDTMIDGSTPVAGLLGRQSSLLGEKIETERAQTLDTRTDNSTTVVGVVGKQKDLYTQQIDAYVKDAEYKAGKMYLDAWITQKTLDEGLLAPAELTNATVEIVLNKIRTNNNLVI